MDSGEYLTLPDVMNNPLWLELRLEDERWLFEFNAREERAVVVGSHSGADVHLPRAGAVTTDLHFERENDAIVVIPGYQAVLRVNAAPALEPARLIGHATIEFRGVVMDATVHDQWPSHLPWATGRAAEASDAARYFESLPEDSDPTGVAIPAASPAWRHEDAATIEMPRAAGSTAGFGPEGTVIMEAQRFEMAPVPVRHAAVDLTATARLQTLATPDSTPTRVDVPVPRRTSAPPPLAGQPPFVHASPAPRRLPALSTESDQDMAHRSKARTPTLSTDMSSPPQSVATASRDLPQGAPAGSVSPLTRRISETPPKEVDSWLARLGRATQRRPLRVIAAAAPAAIIISFALVGAVRLATGHRTTTAPADAATLSTAPASTVSSVSDAEKGMLAAAVIHLANGRNAEARAAYEALAEKNPTNPTYAAIVRRMQQDAAVASPVGSLPAPTQ